MKESMYTNRKVYLNVLHTTSKILQFECVNVVWFAEKQFQCFFKLDVVLIPALTQQWFS